MARIDANQINELNNRIDTLLNENKVLNDKVNSLQQAMSDSIDKFHSIMFPVVVCGV